MAESNNGNEYAGTNELVAVLAQITKLRMAFPENKRIEALAAAGQKVMDAELCQAVLLQLAGAQEEAARSRQSPLAKMMQ